MHIMHERTHAHIDMHIHTHSCSRICEYEPDSLAYMCVHYIVDRSILYYILHKYHKLHNNSVLLYYTTMNYISNSIMAARVLSNLTHSGALHPRG